MRWSVVAGMLVLALSLAACGGGSAEETPSPTPGETSASETPSPTPSAESTQEPTTLADLDSVKVSTDMSQAPTVDAPYPFAVDTTITKVIVEGNGPVVPNENATVNVQYTGINARSGEKFDASWKSGNPVTFPMSKLVKGFGKGVAGHKVGSRLAIAITNQDGYYPNGLPQAGIKPGDTIMFIVDILDSELAGPEGPSVALPDGLPTVSEKDGVPHITIPAGLAEPESVGVQTLIQGSGRALEATDALTSHAVCSTWDGTEFFNDYSGIPSTDSAQSKVHRVIFDSLVGQSMGSRVLLTLPGDQAYPHGSENPPIKPNTAVACAVDILYTQAPPQAG